jgi:hypothetical protein
VAVLLLLPLPLLLPAPLPSFLPPLSLLLLLMFPMTGWCKAVAVVALSRC